MSDKPEDMLVACCLLRLAADLKKIAIMTAWVTASDPLISNSVKKQLLEQELNFETWQAQFVNLAHIYGGRDISDKDMCRLASVEIPQNSSDSNVKCVYHDLKKGLDVACDGALLIETLLREHVTAEELNMISSLHRDYMHLQAFFAGAK